MSGFGFWVQGFGSQISVLQELVVALFGGLRRFSTSNVCCDWTATCSSFTPFPLMQATGFRALGPRVLGFS